VAAPSGATPVRTSAAQSVLRLTARLIRRSAALLLLAEVAYVAIEALTYVATYPDAASRRTLTTFQDNPAARMLQGIPHGVETVGGYVAWDGGWVIGVILTVWAVLTTVKLLRGDEEDGRAEVLLAGALPATTITGLQVAVMGLVAVLLGIGFAVTLIATGGGVAGSAYLGLAMSGLTATFVGVGAVCSQLFGTRRRATSAAIGALGAAFLVRMIANSTDAIGGLRWLTPFGWLDQLQPFANPRPIVVLPAVLAPAVLAYVAVLLRGRRDTGVSLVVEAEDGGGSGRLLSSPIAFAWRSNEGVLLAWLAGLASYAFIAGVLLKSVTDYIAKDENYRRLLETFGLDIAHINASYLGWMAVVLGLFVALYACWRMGAARTEESTGRLAGMLALPVSRRRWLAGHVLLTVAGVVMISATMGVALWAGTVVTGYPVNLSDALAATANPLPLIFAVAGLAVLTFAIVPRLTVGLPATFAIVSLIVELVGPALHWPAGVLDLSVFHHLAYVPAEDFAVLPAIVLLVAGTASIVAGALIFNRRDITGA
jgi:ABC-2 type transport system permease protein